MLCDRFMIDPDRAYQLDASCLRLLADEGTIKTGAVA